MDNVLSIMAMVAPCFLKKITIRSSYVFKLTSLKEILFMKQWKEYKDLELELPKLTLAEGDLLVLKETLEFFPFFKSIAFRSDQVDLDTIYELFGEPTRHACSNINWVRTQFSKNVYLQAISRYKDEYVFSRDVRVETENKDHSPITRNNDTVSRALGINLIMERIVESIDYKDIQRLRKVSNAIRNSVNMLNVNPMHKKLSISFSSIKSNIDVKICSKDNEEFKFHYKFEGNICVLNPEFRKQSYRKEYLHDLQINMKNQKGVLEELCLNVPPLRIDCEDLQERELMKNLMGEEEIDLFFNISSKTIETLKGQKNYFQVTKLNINGDIKNDVIPVTTSLEPCTLTTIEIRYDSMYHINDDLMQKLSNTVQWKCATDLAMTSFCADSEAQLIGMTHFERAEFSVRNISNEDLFNWKEKLLSSPIFQRYQMLLLAKYCTIDTGIYDFLGQPAETIIDEKIGNRMTWYFKMPEDDFAMKLMYHWKKRCMFTKMKISDVPAGARANLS